MCVIEGRGFGKTIRSKKEVARLIRNGIRVLCVSPKDKPRKLRGNIEMPDHMLQAAKNEFDFDDKIITHKKEEK